MVRTPVDSVTTEHAAVNGQSNDLDRSRNLMGIHLSTMFKQDVIKEFTLFHNPTDGGFWDTYESSLDKKQQTTAVSKQFSKVLADVQEIGNPVKWLAHSQGGIIFTEAARYHWENNHTELTKNSVQFNAGANNETKSKVILRDVKIDILGFNNHPFDPVPNLVGGNSKDWISMLGSTIGLFFIFSDNADMSPHTLPYTGDSAVVNNVYGARDKMHDVRDNARDKMYETRNKARDKMYDVRDKVYDVRDKSALYIQSIVNSLPKL